MKTRSLFAGTAFFLIAAFPALAWAAAIDSGSQYAWGENIGWLNWGTSEGNVDAQKDGDFSGYVWGENIGWISLNCSNTSTCGTVNYKVSGSGGTLSGYAWGENVGWISFSCSNTSSCGTVNYGVTIDTGTGDFSGYAWGENIGWVSFNCSNTSTCGTVSYKVASSGTVVHIHHDTPTPTPTDTPTPTFTPTPTPTPTSSASPTPTPTPIPSPSATPSPSVSPSKTPVPLSTPPPATPPPATPTGTPPPGGPSSPPVPGGGGIVQAIDSVGRWLDTLMRFLFGTRIPSAITAGAAAATAVAVIPLAAAALIALVQNEIAALAYHSFVFFGLKRKSKVWGTVYDSQTKHPIPFAKLQLLDETGHVLETRFADRDGRYGFLTNAQSIHSGVLKLRIMASKDGYVFPSQKVSLGVDFIVYDHVYFGQVLELRPDSFLSFNIPMDQLGATRRLSSALGIGLIGTLTDKLLNLAFIAGLFLVPINYLWYPTTTNLVILIAFIVANGLRMLVVYRPYGVVRDAMTKKPLPFALVTLNDLSGKRVAFAVSDERGRYFLAAERGAEYTLSVFTPANITVARSTSVHITPHSRTSRRAWVTLNVSV